MEGFGDAIDGYVDVEDGMARYVLARAEEQFADARAEKRSIDSREEFERRREDVRAAFRSSIGGLPDRMADPSIETTGRLDRTGYAIESVVFESRPDFHVTANCYVPDGRGPHPAVLFLCGHVDDPKADPYNQRACIELARNGFVVLIVDPIAQGERLQYRDPETGEAIVAGGGGVFAHCYVGQKCFYAGANLARYMIHDARCGLDYLEARADVDGDRIGATGSSGGGIQTLYLAALDDRVAAAAPCCSVTTRREWLKTGKRIDAEQSIPAAIPRGIDYDDLLTRMAPRPVCVGAAASDEYFPIEGSREAVDRTRRIYDLYGAGERVNFVVADRPHCSVYELGDGVLEWLCERLGDDEYTPHEDVPIADRTELRCTPAGSVREAYPDERMIDDLIREYVAETTPGGTGSDDGVESDPSGMRDAVIETFDLDREGCELSPRVVERTTVKGLDVERLWFKTERDPDAVVAGVLVSDPRSAADGPAVVLYEGGTEELPARSDDVAALAAEYGAVLVFDPRGVGAVRNREIPIPTWVEDYYGIYGTEFKLAYDALLLGTSLLGMRVYDVIRAAEFLCQETGGDRVSFVGEGTGATHALYAAAAARDVDRVALRDMGPSFAEMATDRNPPFRPELTAFDVVRTCDRERTLAALARRNVAVESGEPSA
ncbi:S9 family peptidase [Saliphagus sp. LR7]|uniref:alpha/beta hydrolase family protein n=1 Tax=Saliphagus sp. LR7 TaxID=2282654 RepID=UPI000DF79F2E|nr:acetylxylan esterase [Saliphagus sp. LR7]